MSGGGGSSSGTQVVQQKADPWAGVQPYLTSMYQQASGLPAQQYYPYQTYAGASPLTDASQQAMLRFAGNALPGYIETGNAGLQSMMSAPDVAANPYVNRMLESQAGQIGDQLRRQWLPGIRSGAAQAGQYGGTRQGVAEGVAIGEAAKALSNAAAQTQLGAYGQGLDSQARAMAFLPQMAQLGMMPSQMLGQVGSSQEAYRQKAIDDARARFDFGQQAPYNQLAFRNNIYSGVPWNQTSTTSGTTGGGSTAANVLGGGLTGFSAGSAIGSAMGSAAPTMLGMGLGPWGALVGAGLGLLM